MVHQTNDHGYRRMSELNLAGFLARSAANGPGIRAVIWVQGCPIRCKECFNPAFWSFSPVNRVSAGEISAGSLLSRISTGSRSPEESPLHRQTHLHLWEKRCRKRGIRS